MQGGERSLGERVFAGPGEMRERCRQLDWSKTPLGPIAGWRPFLVSAVTQVLAQPFPSALYWGAQQVLIYNDGLCALLGNHHPASLGRPARELAADAWGLREPVHSRVRAGESLVFEDEPHVLQRAGEQLNAWFTVGFCPLSDGAGNVVAVLATALETTARVRSVAALRESKDRETYLPMLSDALHTIPDAPGIASRAERMLQDRLVADRVFYTELEQRGATWVDAASEGSADERLDFGSARAFALCPTLAATVPYGIGLVESDVVRSTRLNAAERAALRARRIGALVVLPLMRSGKLRATTLVINEHARRWSEHELVLIGETAERIWAAVERARANVALRRSEARQSFMVQLGDALRALTDPRQIESDAVALIAARLGVDSAYYVELDGQRQQVAVWQAASAHVPLRPLGSFGLAPWAGLVAALRTGEPFVIDDVNGTTRIPAVLSEMLTSAGARATLTIPILQRGQLLAALCVAQRQARRWSGDEILLLAEATERSWAAIDRARTEQARRNSEQKYQTLFDSIDEGVAMLELVLDGAGICQGYDVLEHNLALGRLLGGLAAPEGLPGLATCRLEQVMRTGESARFEQAVPELGRWLELKISRVGAQGSRFLVVVYTDISEHKHSEQVLRDSEARQRFLLGLSDLLRPLGSPAEIEALVARTLGEHLAADRTYYVTCPEGTALIHRDYARPPLSSVAGSYPLADFPWMVQTASTGRTLVLGDVPGEGAVSASEQQQLEALGLGAVIVTPILRAALLVGALVVASLTPRRWTSAEVSLVEEVGTRTWAALEHRRIEAAYRASEARFRAFVEYVREYAIFLVDTQGRITEWTAGAERVTGYAAADVLGRHLSLLCSAEDVAHAEPEAALREAELLGRAERETWRVRKDGRRYWVNEVATAVRDDVGKLVGFTIISRDQSEPRRSREQREGLLAAATAAHEEAERANLAKDEVLGTLGHELRTPLAAILLWGAALRSGAVADADTGRAVDAILQSAKTQSRLVDDLLDLSRLSAGKLLLSPAPVAVDAIAHAACDMVEPMARGKQVGLALFLGDDLGRGVFDAARLQQVLWNLLTNAIKFTPQGGRVTLRVSRSESMLEIEVADTGQGIAPEFLPHVFERFRQADMGQTREHGGLGIGLALCRHLVELQRGTIEAHSDGLGRGSVFRVRLPWQDLGAALEAPEDEAPPSRPARLRGVRVLLVEDDRNTREVMAWTLNNAGACVVAVETGAEALGQLHAGHAERAGDDFDVIISDLGLPEMSGHDLIERAARLRQARGQAPLPACAVSAHVRDTDRQRAIDAGYDLYLAKPITPEQLLEAVEDLRDVAAEPGRMARIS